MLLKKQYGYRLHIPPIFTTKHILQEIELLQPFLYDAHATYYYQKFQLNLSESAYFRHTEFVLRGLLTTAYLFENIKSWSYFTVHNPEGLEISNNLLYLKSDIPHFDQTIRHQKNKFFKYIPLQALQQFFPNLSFSKIEEALLDHGHFLPLSHHTKTSLLSSLLQNQNFLKQLKASSCFFLEDLADQYDKFSPHLSRISKDELTHLLAALFPLLHQKSTYHLTKSHLYEKYPMIIQDSSLSQENIKYFIWFHKKTA